MRTGIKRAPLVLAAAVAALAACTSGSGSPVTLTVNPPTPSAVAPTTSGTAPSTEPTTPTSSASSKPRKPATLVHVSALENDHLTYGVGMPIVLFFSPPPTDSTAFTQAVKVTVDGRPAGGAWYWEQPTHDEVASNTIEAHYRLQNYWPAHSHIHVTFPLKGLSAGKGLAYDGALTSLDFFIGAKHVSVVNGQTEKMHVYSDDKLVRTIRVSLGEAQHPTYTGTKLVMQKGEDVPGTNKLRPDGTVLMSGQGYTDTPVQWSVRITLSGEYVHSAPWNGLIGRSSTSHGCTNLFPDAAKWFYHFARLGDVLTYSNTGGQPMPPLDGLGDWNISWGQWAQGGLLLNH
jgi:Bacterial Ig domain/L,D-transpeptidase catalytic domain